jgi:hypothetical protein
MERGGFILLASGYEDKEASLPLLRELDLDIMALKEQIEIENLDSASLELLMLLMNL